MTCREYEHIIDDYLVGRLDESELRRFNGHLAECEACRVRAAQDRRLYELLKGDSFTDPGEGYWNYLEKSILSRTVENYPEVTEIHYEAKPGFSRRLVQYLVPLAASIALIFASFSDFAIGPRQPMTAEYIEVNIGDGLSGSERLFLMEECLQSERLGSILLPPPGSPLRPILIGEIEKQ
ncbi:MAG: zf-HC2 domain-containing protein [Candidatus Zixiibacteriota bacterium]